MSIEFRYQCYTDLVYHILAHIPLNNPADEYDPKYIRDMSSALRRTIIVPPAVREYYQSHFDSVGVIHFMPLIAENNEQCLAMLSSGGMLTEKAMSVFIHPFLDLVKAEEEAYEGWWTKRFSSTREQRALAEEGIRSFMDRFSSFFNHESTEFRLILSYSLQKNGRLAEFNGEYLFYIPFPADAAGLLNAQLQILHEWTHHVTDPLLGDTIQMNDGTHETAEYQVILFDDYLIGRASPFLLDTYREWVGTEELSKAEKALGEDRVALLKEMIRQYE